MSIQFQVVGHKGGSKTNLYSGGGTENYAIKIGEQYSRNQGHRFDIIRVIDKDSGSCIASF